jgi:hypothetical protein
LIDRELVRKRKDSLTFTQNIAHNISKEFLQNTGNEPINDS